MFSFRPVLQFSEAGGDTKNWRKTVFFRKFLKNPASYMRLWIENRKSLDNDNMTRGLLGKTQNFDLNWN